MIQSRLLGPQILRVPLATALVLSAVLGASTAWTQSQPPGPVPAPKLSEAERAQKFQQRDRLRAEAIKLARAGKLDKALATATNVLAIERRVLGELHEDVVGSLQFLAALQEARRDWAAARKPLTEVLTIRQRQPDQKDWRIADARRALADLDRRAAFDPAQQQRLREANRLNQLQDAFYKQGKYAEGIDPCRQAMEIRGELLGKEHPNYATSLNNLTALYGDMNDYAKAEPLLRNSLEIYKRALGENDPHYATSLNCLGLLYQAMGDHRHVPEIKKRALGENHPNYANSLNNLGALYQAMGDYAKAEPLFRRALRISKQGPGEHACNYADSLNNLATLYGHMGDYAKAEPLLRQALEIRKRALGESHPEYASSLNNLAMLYQDLGDYAKAEPLFRNALEIKKRALGENHPDYAQSLNSLSSLYLSQGQLAAAERLLSQGLTILTRWTQEGLATLGERQRIRLLGAQGQILDAYFSVAPAAGIKVEELYRHVLAWKGVVEARQDEDRLARDQPELKETLGQLEQARARLAGLAFTAPPDVQRQAWLQQLDALRDRKENLESDLARKSAAFRQVQESWRLGAAEVAAVLPPGAALIDLLNYAHASPPEGGKGPFRWESRLVAFVLRRGQVPVLVSLGASRPISQAVHAWRQALFARTPEPMQAAAMELSRRVWEPLKPHLEGAATVLVAPDGALSYFPIAALPGHRPGTYLLDDLAIGYVSSAHRLVETLAAPAETKPESPEADAAGLLAIGGIDYQADPGGAAPTESAPISRMLVANSQRAAFGPLAGTGPEVRRIGQLFGAAFPQQHAMVLTGAAPTEAAVKLLLGRHWRNLHLATHGFFESPARVAAMRAGLKSDGFGVAGNGSSEESASLALSPLLHSGVALAGAGRKTEDAGPGAQGSLPDREDGILTAEEVQSLDLRGTDLVVLSACETGLGLGNYGQGVMGLQRAFQAAGARTVVASLWRVDDAATTVLME